MRLPLVLAFLLALAPFGAHAQAPVAGADPGAATLPEQVMGDPAAPVTLIEYASLTCPHCAHFANEILPKVVEKYISTGKVKLIYRDFPLDALSLHAAQLAQCLPQERYFVFVKTLFANQENWLKSTDPEATLQQYAKLAGLSDEKVKACLADKKLEQALVQRRLYAGTQFKVNSTPSFVVNYGKDTISGAHNFDEFDKMLAPHIK
jgi:protein-disulfide isomerase